MLLRWLTLSFLTRWTCLKFRWLLMKFFYFYLVYVLLFLLVSRKCLNTSMGAGWILSCDHKSIDDTCAWCWNQIRCWNGCNDSCSMVDPWKCRRPIRVGFCPIPFILHPSTDISFYVTPYCIFKSNMEKYQVIHFTDVWWPRFNGQLKNVSAPVTLQWCHISHTCN